MDINDYMLVHLVCRRSSGHYLYDPVGPATTGLLHLSPQKVRI